MVNRKEFLFNSFSEIGLTLSDEQVISFLRYYEMLVNYEEANITAIKDYEEVVIKHFIDSVSLIFLADTLNMEKCKNVLDIGSGAGFPGIPLKILFPRLNMVLLDSSRKRVDFLHLISKELFLKNIKVLHGRAEEYAVQKREEYDLVVTRAVADFRIMAELTLPFINLKGSAVIYRGVEKVNYNEYDDLLKYLGGEIRAIKEFIIGESEYGRSLVQICKVKNTPDKVPRKNGMAFKKEINRFT